jgi:glucosamine 6-phosphate synthetase-like amidotransferase/phosphosugar isomerase protein
MEDGQICTLTPSGIAFASLGGYAGVPPEGKIVEIDWSPSMAEKDGYDHFMLKEIHEQTRTIPDSLRGHVESLHSRHGAFGIPEGMGCCKGRGGSRSRPAALPTMQVLWQAISWSVSPVCP